MYTIELNVDDSIFDTFMESLNELPKDKLEIITQKKHLNASAEELKIIGLLDKHRLSHFKFIKDPERLIYTKDSGTPRHIDDYKKLINILNENNINHSDIGIDILLIEIEEKKD